MHSSCRLIKFRTPVISCRELGQAIFHSYGHRGAQQAHLSPRRFIKMETTPKGVICVSPSSSPSHSARISNLCWILSPI